MTVVCLYIYLFIYLYIYLFIYLYISCHANGIPTRKIRSYWVGRAGISIAVSMLQSYINILLALDKANLIFCSI